MRRVFWKLRSGVTRLTGVVKSLERGEIFPRSHLQNRQNADEINSAGENLSVESDSQANHRNQTKVLPATTTLKRKAASSVTNDSYLFMSVLRDQVIAFWTSPRVLGVASEDNYSFTTGKWGKSPAQGAPLDGFSILYYKDILSFSLLPKEPSLMQRMCSWISSHLHYLKRILL